MSNEPSSVCGTCSAPLLPADPSLLCRGCGWTSHTSCIKGAKLCPRCSKPLVTPLTAVGFADNRAQAKRIAEYRVSASCVGGSLYVGVLATLLQLVTEAWPGGWLEIPFGTWINLSLCVIIAATSVAFLRVRHPVVALTALLMFTAVAIGFLPGALVCLNTLVPSDQSRWVLKLSLLCSMAPMAFAAAAWWEYSRWKKIPGDSGGVALKSSVSMFAPMLEALSAALPAAVSLWILLIPQKRKPR